MASCRRIGSFIVFPPYVAPYLDKDEVSLRVSYRAVIVKGMRSEGYKVRILQPSLVLLLQKGSNVNDQCCAQRKAAPVAMVNPGSSCRHGKSCKTIACRDSGHADCWKSIESRTTNQTDWPKTGSHNRWPANQLLFNLILFTQKLCTAEKIKAIEVETMAYGYMSHNNKTAND